MEDEAFLPTTLDLNGIWLQVQDPSWLGLLVRFSPDHTFAMDDRGDLDSDPAALGTYRLDERTITFTSQGSDLCTEGDSWAWDANLPENGRLHIVHTEEAADPCRVPLGRDWAFIRVSPNSVPLRDGLAGAITTGEPQEVRHPTAGDLAGIWLPAEAQGLLIRLGPDGTFAFDNHGVIDTVPAIRGTHDLDGNTISFTVGGGPACTGGDGWVWRASLLKDGLLRIVHTKEGTGNCHVPRGTEWTLIRVSPSSAASAEIAAE